MTAATLPSRIKSPHAFLRQVRRLQARTSAVRELAWQMLIRVQRSAVRADTPDSLRWCQRVADSSEQEVVPHLTAALKTVERLIAEGDAVLPAHADPRDQRRVRKSKR